jgi:hypothetical protein
MMQTVTNVVFDIIKFVDFIVGLKEGGFLCSLRAGLAQISSSGKEEGPPELLHCLSLFLLYFFYCKAVLSFLCMVEVYF